MIAKDWYCSICSNEIHDRRVKSTDVCKLRELCDICHAVTEHYVLCNGGVRGRRWRYVDWTPEAANNLVRYHGVKTDADDGEGGRVHDDPRFSDDAIDDRRQRMKHDRDKARDKGKLVFSG